MVKHVIEKGESLEKIEKKHKISVQNIIDDNKIQDRTRLGIGNILNIREAGENIEKPKN